MKHFQTDEDFNIKINKYGCLFFSLVDIAEEYTGKSLSYLEIVKLYNHLTTTTFESNRKEYLLMEKDCYINSHTKVLQDILENFNSHDKVSYAGSWYNDQIVKRKSWGERYGMFMILQFKTVNGNGHFRRPHYDPYQPLIKFSNLMSIRYYNIGV